jgi:hypothetical protein
MMAPDYIYNTVIFVAKAIVAWLSNVIFSREDQYVRVVQTKLMWKNRKEKWLNCLDYFLINDVFENN